MPTITLVNLLRTPKKDIKSLNKTLDKNKRELASFDKIEVLKSKNPQSSTPKNTAGNIVPKPHIGGATSTF